MVRFRRNSAHTGQTAKQWAAATFLALCLCAPAFAARTEIREFNAKIDNKPAGSYTMSIVEGKDATTVVDDKDRTMIAVHNEPPFRLKFLKAAG